MPLAGIVALAALAVIPRGRLPRVRRRFDVPGAMTITAGATLLVFALVQGKEIGRFHPGIPLAAVLAAAFAVVEGRGAEPLMPPRLARNRSRLAGVSVAIFGRLPYGYSALAAELAFLVRATGTQLGERPATRLGTRVTLVAGFVAGVAGMALLAAGGMLLGLLVTLLLRRRTAAPADEEPAGVRMKTAV
ncbi:hypothetical protein ABZ801_40380 [Actinomadura sp. NPDC047616]|uniref:hypothetical protein n=1 Tax=Actinomadura sp. NPDC047616 TaxID=3155914 RepID=UPI0033C1615B